MNTLQEPVQVERKFRKGPGLILKTYLRKRWIKPTNGCNCYELADYLDKHGPLSVLENIQFWTDEMTESAKKWKKFHNRSWIAAFVKIDRDKIQKLIIWACNESIKTEVK